MTETSSDRWRSSTFALSIEFRNDLHARMPYTQVSRVRRSISRYGDIGEALMISVDRHKADETVNGCGSAKDYSDDAKYCVRLVP
jgi:hypothetical protein